MVDGLRKTGISIVGDIPWGTHFCHFYETHEDLLDVLIPYFKTGLENDEFCMWIVFPPRKKEEAVGALQRALPGAHRHLAAGDIEIIPHLQWYLKDGTFDLQRVIDSWQKKLDDALSRGYAGMRVNGNEAWLTEKDWKDFLEYEKRLNDVISGRRIIVLCTYPLALAKAADIFDVARSHEFAIARRSGNWEVLETPELSHAKTEIMKLNEELGRGVDERTKELAGTNEELRREIAGRKLVEEELRLFRNLIDHANDAINVVDPETGRFLDVNAKSCSSLGYTREELLGMRVFDVTKSIPDTSSWTNHVREVKDAGQVVFEATQTGKDGTTAPVEVNVIYVSLGRRDYLVAVVRDITERKRLQNEVLLQQQRLNSFFKGATAGLVLLDRDLRFIQINDTLADMNGFPAEEHIGRTVREILPELAPVIEPIFQRVLTTREPVLDIEISGETPRHLGFRRHWLESFFPVVDTDGNLDGVGAIVVEITKLKHAEEALQESERKYKSLVETTVDGIFQSDADGVFRFINQAGAEMFGHKSPAEMIGKSVLDYWVDLKERASFLDELKREKGLRAYPIRGRKKDGSVRHLEMSSRVLEDGQGRFMGVEGILRDVTEKVDLEAQLRHAQKMEAIGQLAGGVAHDFNNILSAIIGYGHVTLIKMARDDPQRLNIQQILDAADRAAHLTKDLLLFSRKQISDRNPVDLNEIIRTVEKFLVRVIGEDIAFKTILHEGAIPVLADVHQLEQVLMNLATNARDAMPKGGILTIATEQIMLDKEFIAIHGYGKSGMYALVTVSDTGMGERTQQRIFEPFFTTKDVGKGTGLGMAVVYGIIKQHDGYINVYSEPGKGTTFRIYLPVIAAEIIGEKKAVQVDYPERGTETILLAEDDESLRELTVSVLQEFGYEVIVAVDGEDAVKKYIENKDRIQLLLFDIVMPKKTGKEAYDEIKRIKPDIRVIFLSGYAPDIIRQKALIHNNEPVVHKPISPATLLKKVRSVLN